jgi:flagellar biosynthesis protein FliR
MTLEQLVALVPAFLLIVCRMVGLVLTAPVLGGGQIPAVVRAGVALGLAALTAPIVQFDPAAIPAEIVPYAVAASREIIVGLAIGFAASLLFLGLQLAGEVIDVQMGFMMANVTDPSTNLSVPLMGQFLYLLALLAFLAMRGHHWLIRAIVQSYQFVPLAGATYRPGLWTHGNTLVSEVFLEALQFGGPVVAALLLTEASMGIIGRTVPQMNILMLGFSIRIAVGFAVVWFVLSSMFDILAVSLDRNGLFADLVTLTRGMGPPPVP